MKTARVTAPTAAVWTRVLHALRFSVLGILCQFICDAKKIVDYIQDEALLKKYRMMVTPNLCKCEN